MSIVLIVRPWDDANVEAGDVECDGVRLWRVEYADGRGEDLTEQQAKNAMDNATKNAGDLIDELTREMNKERQSSITLELMDIIGGAEAVG